MKYRAVRIVATFAVLWLAACGSTVRVAAPAARVAASADTTSCAPSVAIPSAPPRVSAASGEPQTLRLATTTSTADSGLLDAILPDFETRNNAQVEVVAVGTGQALKIGASGDADVVLVHARKQEDAFVAAGDGINRRDVMYNDFVIVGPVDDPASIRGFPTAQSAFQAIADHGATFAARGDNSGTATKELAIWASLNISPTDGLDWYKSLGQGMGETLNTANELPAYTLADRGTYLSQCDTLPNLAIVVGGASIEANTDPTLLNPYGVIVVNPATHPGVNAVLAEQFAAWLTSSETQQMIDRYGVERFGQPLFHAAAAP